MSERSLSEGHTPCPDVEVLAAFIDGTIDASERADVIAHVATCEDCAELVAEVLQQDEDNLVPDFAAQAIVPPRELAPPLTRAAAVPLAASPIVRRPFGSRRTVIAGGVLAAAAAVFFVVTLQPVWLQPWLGGADPNFEKLIAAAGPQRPIDGRVSGFPHQTRQPVRRSGGSEPGGNLALQAVGAELGGLVGRDRSPAARHAYGVSQLLLGQNDEAVRMLESVAGDLPARADVLSDLSAAYLARGRQYGVDADVRRAVETAGRAVRVDPGLLAGWFNRAAALEALPDPAAAIAAWNDYEQREPQVEWLNEARTRRATLEQAR